MTSVQLHLALTHVPVILSFVGLLILIAAFLRPHNTTLTLVAYVLMAVAAIAAIPVFLSGEGAEEAIENLPGVAEAIIEEHEELAKFAFIAVLVSGAIALIGLFAQKWPMALRPIKVLLLVMGLLTAGLMFQTAHLGGQIRHTEVRAGSAVTVQTERQDD